MLEKTSYIPLLSLKPAELTAFEELPQLTKDQCLVHLNLRRWLSSNSLDNSLKRIEKAFAGNRLAIAVRPSDVPDVNKPVASTIRMLIDPRNAYENWVSFVREHKTFIPSLQFSSLDQLALQAERTLDLGRGLFVRIEEKNFSDSAFIAETIGAIDRGKYAHYIIDFGRKDKNTLPIATSAAGLIRTISKLSPASSFTIAASTFPSSFVGLKEQPVFERALSDFVAATLKDLKLVYGDYGSVNLSDEDDFRGSPAPRIDLPLSEKWLFFRHGLKRKASKEERREGYTQAASAATESAHWDDTLQIWGTYMIRKTASGERAIDTSTKATATRINLHMHKQAHFGSDGLYETEDQWVD